MKRLFTKKRIAIFATIPFLALGGMVAYAFWTTGGAGSGAATAGAPTSNLTIDASAPTTMVLGGSSVVNLSVTNPYSYHVDLNGDTAVPSSYECNGTAVSSSWFTLSGNPISAPDVIAPGGPTAVNDSGLTLTLNDSLTDDQDICQGAAVTFSIAVTAESGAH